jgi:hypothetical protein
MKVGDKYQCHGLVSALDEAYAMVVTLRRERDEARYSRDAAEAQVARLRMRMPAP